MIAEKGHLPALNQIPELDLHAVYDTDFERAKALQREFGMDHAYPAEEDFYAADLDAIVICTPAPMHYGT